MLTLIPEESTVMDASTTPIRILIADDHEMVRQGLRTFLELDPELEVVGEAADGREAVRLAHRLRPAVVLMDLLMPELDGIAATQLIRQELPDTEVVALTSVLEDASVVGAAAARGHRARAAGDLVRAGDRGAAAAGARAGQQGHTRMMRTLGAGRQAADRWAEASARARRS
jgi:DNA-binding NarL/FixJ family response regulator